MVDLQPTLDTASIGPEFHHDPSQNTLLSDLREKSTCPDCWCSVWNAHTLPSAATQERHSPPPRQRCGDDTWRCVPSIKVPTLTAPSVDHPRPTLRVPHTTSVQGLEGGQRVG